METMSTYPLHVKTQGAMRMALLAIAISHSLIFSFSQSLLLRDYQFVRQQDAWLTSDNAAALTRFTAQNIAEANLALTTEKGGLANYYEPASALEVNAAVESLYRLSRRTVVFGSIGYNNLSGSDMTGSAFMHLPTAGTRYPFTIDEDSLTNAGDKHRDTYRLTGAVGIDVWRGYAVGLRLDYTAANMAKYKDLRHKNKLMDLRLGVSAYAPVLPWLSVGAGYTYHRNTESLSFSTYGKSEKVYKSLINYGGFFGTVEQFGNEGYTDKSREMPLFEDGHEGNFQLGLRPLPQFSVVGTLRTAHGDGYYGRKSPYTITYTQHDRDLTAATLSLLYQPLTRASRHRLDLSYTTEKLQNRAETYRELTNSAGATYYEYYDPVETADKKWKDASVAYTAQLAIRGELPTWELQAAYRWSRRELTAYLYPFYRHQQLTTGEASVSATRNIVGRQGVWSFTLQGAFSQGSGNPFEDYTFVEPSAKQEPPATMDAFLWREYQYLTAAQYGIGGTVKYAFRIPGTQLKTHALLHLSHRKANETYDYSTGCDRMRLTVAVGCTF